MGDLPPTLGWHGDTPLWLSCSGCGLGPSCSVSRAGACIPAWTSEHPGPGLCSGRAAVASGPRGVTARPCHRHTHGRAVILSLPISTVSWSGVKPFPNTEPSTHPSAGQQQHLAHSRIGTANSLTHCQTGPGRAGEEGGLPGRVGPSRHGTGEQRPPGAGGPVPPGWNLMDRRGE